MHGFPAHAKPPPPPQTLFSDFFLVVAKRNTKSLAIFSSIISPITHPHCSAHFPLVSAPISSVDCVVVERAGANSWFPPPQLWFGCAGHVTRSEYTSLKKNVTRQVHTPSLAHGQRNDHSPEWPAAGHGTNGSSPLAAKAPQDAITRKRLPIKLDVSVHIVPKQSQSQELCAAWAQPM